MYTIKAAQALLNDVADENSLTLAQSPDFGMMVPKEEAEAARLDKFLSDLVAQGFVKKQPNKSRPLVTYTKDNLVVLVREPTGAKYRCITGVDITVDGKYTAMAEGTGFMASIIRSLNESPKVWNPAQIENHLDKIETLLFNRDLMDWCSDNLYGDSTKLDKVRTVFGELRTAVEVAIDPTRASELK
jgi:hypothetical protein